MAHSVNAGQDRKGLLWLGQGRRAVRVLGELQEILLCVEVCVLLEKVEDLVEEQWNWRVITLGFGWNTQRKPKL